MYKNLANKELAKNKLELEAIRQEAIDLNGNDERTLVDMVLIADKFETLRKKTKDRSIVWQAEQLEKQYREAVKKEKQDLITTTEREDNSKTLRAELGKSRRELVNAQKLGDSVKIAEIQKEIKEIKYELYQIKLLEEFHKTDTIPELEGLLGKVNEDIEDMDEDADGVWEWAMVDRIELKLAALKKKEKENLKFGNSGKTEGKTEMIPYWGFSLDDDSSDGDSSGFSSNGDSSDSFSFGSSSDSFSFGSSSFGSSSFGNSDSFSLN